jgi:hypothetical protein
VKDRFKFKHQKAGKIITVYVTGTYIKELGQSLAKLDLVLCECVYGCKIIDNMKYCAKN